MDLSYTAFRSIPKKKKKKKTLKNKLENPSKLHKQTKKEEVHKHSNELKYKTFNFSLIYIN
jgi:hypothetical protein